MLTPRKENHITKALDWLGIPIKKQLDFIIKLAIYWIVMTSIMVISNNAFLNENLVEGTAADETIITPYDLEVSDDERTEMDRQKAIEDTKPEYSYISGRSEEMVKAFDKNMISMTAFYDAVNDKVNGKSAGNLYRNHFPDGFILGFSELNKIVTFPVFHFERLKSTAREKLVELSKKQITKENIDNYKTEISIAAKQLTGETSDFKRIFEVLLEKSLVVNSEIDVEKTKIAKQEAARQIIPIKVIYKKGQRIVTKGDIITKEEVNAYNAMKSNIKTNALKSILGSVIFMFFIISTAIIYIRIQDINVFVDDAQYKLIAWLGFAFLLATKVVYGVAIDYSKDYVFVLFVPVSSFTLLLASTVSNMKIVLFSMFWSTSVGVLFCDSHIGFLIGNMFASTAGLLGWDYSTKRNGTDQRKTLTNTGLNIGIANAIVLLSFILYSPEYFEIKSLNHFLTYLGCAFANGLIAGIVTIGILPYLENWFAFATPTKLLELTSLEHPLLKRLREEAPGTFQHCRAVSDMASAAAIAVGADQLLTKVAALYHDIGKLDRPEYFTENQHGVNPHDDCSPTMSAMIITGHVKAGRNIGSKGGLPSRVIETMEQHHGTTLVSYFYNKQKALTPEGVDEYTFRYRSSKPKTKEAAIIMLADAVEAWSKSLDPNFFEPEKLKEGIDKIVKGKEEDDKQFEDCDLTKKDITAIKEVFVKFLISDNHKRIKYQNQESEKEKQSEKAEK